MLPGNLASRMPNIRRLLPRLLIVSAAFAVAVALPGCVREEKPAEVKTVAERFPMRIGDCAVRLQVAVHQPEQNRGLMDRSSLGADEGMIFVYAEPRQMSFWMHNTLIPLDIGFFDAKGEALARRPAGVALARSLSMNFLIMVGQKTGRGCASRAARPARAGAHRGWWPRAR